MPSVSAASNTVKATSETTQQQQNRHKIHELKASSVANQNPGSPAMISNASQILAGTNIPPSSSTNFLQLIIPPTIPPLNEGNNGGGRSSANMLCASSNTSNSNQDNNSPRTPLRSATALPSVGSKGKDFYY